MRTFLKLSTGFSGDLISHSSSPHLGVHADPFF
jgi:hypothetical protein